MKFPTFSLLFSEMMTHMPYHFAWNCVKSVYFIQRTFQNIGSKRLWFSNNLVLFVIKYHLLFLIMNWVMVYIFHSFFWTTWPIFQPFLTLSANSWFLTVSRSPLPMRTLINGNHTCPNTWNIQKHNTFLLIWGK